MLQAAVGRDRPNKTVDVALVQRLLNDVQIPGVVASCTLVDGLASEDLNKRIEAYQTAKGMATIDGWIGAGGATNRSLVSDAKFGTDRMMYIRRKLQVFGKPVLSRLNVEAFLSGYDRQYSALTGTNREGLRSLATKVKTDSDIRNLPEFAYMLATTKHETAHTFRPIDEYGKGAGKSYGVAVTVTDPNTKETYENAYYGRGYLQLTHATNYQKVDEKLGYGTYPNKNSSDSSLLHSGFTIHNSAKSIYLHPELAKEEKAAYTALVWGMQNGPFTGVATPRYINEGAVDYYNARRIINGTDKAGPIAGYAENFEIMLRVYCWK